MCRKSFADATKSNAFDADFLREDTMTGTIPSMVFCTTLKLEASSRWKTLEPIKVKTGMILCNTESGARRVRFDIRINAWWKVCGLSVTASRVSSEFVEIQKEHTSNELHQDIQSNGARRDVRKLLLSVSCNFVFVKLRPYRDFTGNSVNCRHE